MKNLLIYYGWLNSFNSTTNESNGWNNEKVAQNLAKYDILVFGDGIGNSSHGDYSNTQVIIPRIKELNPYAMIYGYASTNQSFSSFKTKVDEWNTLGIHGIFFDESGYDYGSVSTNGREAFNLKVDYVHSVSISNKCFINAWNPDHVLGTANDTSYPNTSYNPNLLESNLKQSDWFLLESFAIDTSYTFESATQWYSRGEAIKEKKEEFGINLAAVSVVPDSTGAQADFDFVYTSALMWSLDAIGSADTFFGASSSTTKTWTRPDTKNLSYEVLIPAINVDTGDSDVYMRYVPGGEMRVDFSSGSETSSIVKY